MTSEEMEPDVEPPVLPLQGAGALPASAITRASTSVRQPTGHPQQPATRKVAISRSSPSARSATRVATQVRRPIPTARKPVERPAIPAVAANPQLRSTRAISNNKPKPLLPITERRTQDQKPAVTRLRTNSETEKWDIAPDGHSAGREGRQFAVANVGNNGRIYLRYVQSHSLMLATTYQGQLVFVGLHKHQNILIYGSHTL